MTDKIVTLSEYVKQSRGCETVLECAPTPEVGEPRVQRVYNFFDETDQARRVIPTKIDLFRDSRVAAASRTIKIFDDDSASAVDVLEQNSLNTEPIRKFTLEQPEKNISFVNNATKSLSGFITGLYIKGQALAKKTVERNSKNPEESSSKARRILVAGACLGGVVIGAYVAYKFLDGNHPVGRGSSEFDSNLTSTDTQPVGQLPRPSYTEALTNYRGTTWDTTTRAAYNFIKNSNPDASPSRIASLFARARDYMAQNGSL